MLRRAGVLSLTLLSTACYTYQEVSTGPSIASGGVVRIELTDNGTADLAKQIGPYVMIVEGIVRSNSEQGLTVDVSSLRRRGEADTQWTGQSLTIPRMDIRVLSQRSPSRGKTAAAIAIFGAIGVGLVIAIARATGLVSGSAPTGQPVPST